MSAAVVMADVIQLESDQNVDDDDKPVGVDLLVLLTMVQVSGWK